MVKLGGMDVVLGQGRDGRRIAAIHAELDGWVDELVEEATEVAQAFAEQMYAYRDTKAPKYWFRYGVRIKETKSRERSIAIEWRRMHWRKYGDKTTYRAENIPKGPGTRYPQTRFTPVDEVEANLIETCEDRFAQIRTELKRIGSIRRMVAATRKKETKK